MLKSGIKSCPSATDPFFPGYMRHWEEDLHWSTTAECWCPSTNYSFEHVKGTVSTD